jgi:hypothetical protein
MTTEIKELIEVQQELDCIVVTVGTTIKYM